MPSKLTRSTLKRKASVSAIEDKENKVVRTSNSCDAPTSRKGVPCYSHLGLYFIFSFCYIDTVVEETTKRATRINRGQGGHAYQLEKALNPITKDQRRRANEAIPENVPDNPMAPQVLLNKAQSKNVVITVFYRY